MYSVKDFHFSNFLTFSFLKNFLSFLRFFCEAEKFFFLSLQMWFHGVKSFVLIRCWWFELSNSFWMMHKEKKGLFEEKRKIIIKRHTSKVPHEIFPILWESRAKRFIIYIRNVCAGVCLCFRAHKFKQVLENFTRALIIKQTAMIYDQEREKFLFADDIFCEWKLTLEKMLLIFCVSEDIKVSKHVQMLD